MYSLEQYGRLIFFAIYSPLIFCQSSLIVHLLFRKELSKLYQFVSLNLVLLLTDSLACENEDPAISNLSAERQIVL
jgi:hypothetical protein